MAGTLYIVATPIGNLEDITYRAIRILKEVDLILAEDTRKTGIIMKHYDINNSILSYHQHSSETRKYEILQNIITGKNIALVTDAGTPGISDPGNELISFLIEKEPGINIVPIPGASAITASLSVSGLNVNKFFFLGFLPKKGKQKLYNSLKESEVAFAFYESPHRIMKTLAEIEEKFGSGTSVFIARELTKIHETLYRGTVDKVRKEMESGTVKGEIVVVVYPRKGNI